MQLLEHVAKAIAAEAGIPIPNGEVAATPEEAQAIAARLGSRVVVKAQVPIGGRGRAGGVVLADAAEAGAAARRLLGSTVRGFRVDSVLVEEAVEVVQELYLSVAVRPARREVALLLSSAGGTEVEVEAPGHLGLVSIPIQSGHSGLRAWHVWRAATSAGIDAALVPALIDYARRAHELFWQERAELVEINPLFVTPTGGLVAGDVRIVPDAEASGDEDDPTPPEQRFDFLVLNPEGRVGLVTTGAGGSMHLIDRLSEAGLAPIDFCDLRTGRPRGLVERLTTAFRRLDAMPNLECIAINFFAGVTILDEVAPVLRSVIESVRPRAPVVARLEGRGAEAARASLAEIGVRCATSLDELVALVAKVAPPAKEPPPPSPLPRARERGETGTGGFGVDVDRGGTPEAGGLASDPARAGTPEAGGLASDLDRADTRKPAPTEPGVGAGFQQPAAASPDPNLPPSPQQPIAASPDPNLPRLLPPLRAGEAVGIKGPHGRGAPESSGLRGRVAGRGGEVRSLWALLDNASQGVIVQGMTGQIGRRHTSRMRAYGTPIAAGVTPGRGGTVVDDVPVFNTVAEAVDVTGASTSIAFLPGEVAPDGIMEAAEAGIGLCVCPTEGMRLHDTLRALDTATRHGTRVIGPNTGGLLVPGTLALGFLPSDFARPGPCVVLSRSGTLSYETVLALANVGIGVAAWIGVGGDRVKGSTFADLLPDLLADARTGAVVLLGEIGGTDEEDAAAILSGASVPAVALLAGRTAPAGISMGHAGAIVDGPRGSYDSKHAALTAAGVAVAHSPTEIADILRARLAPVR